MERPQTNIFVDSADLLQSGDTYFDKHNNFASDARVDCDAESNFNIKQFEG